MASKGNKRADADVFDVNAAPSAGGSTMGQHGFKGILGAERAKTYTPSSYGGGDSGGSAGGYGLPHGAAGGASGGGGEGSRPMPSFGYAGAPLGFEGGVRGGAVSEPETQAAQYEYPKKTGYDEHQGPRGGMETVHGVPGVEGLPGHTMGDQGSADMGKGDHGAAGHSCHACGVTRKTMHGLVSHTVSKHGARAMAHRMGMGSDVPSTLGVTHPIGLEAPTHGTSFVPGQEFRGETEGPEEWSKLEGEFHQAQARAERGAGSSYSTGDSGGSYATMKAITG